MTARTGRMNASDEANAYPAPHVTVDLVIFTVRDEQLHVLLMKRGAPPHKGLWALPGGYIHPEEDLDLDATARRILLEKAGIETPYLEQLQGFGSATRDPRGWTATFTYFALISSETLALRQGANAEKVAWRTISGYGAAPGLAFDHDQILTAAVTRLRSKVEYTSLPVHLLPTKFTLTDLQRIYEQILARPMDKSAFRKRIAREDFLEPVEGEMRRASNRPAQIYRLKPGQATAFFDSTI
ncbi:NUDIX domain-containing protein [Oleomonas cavernae]|uniref:NUDIX domain-containing protein n=1 Tax=Oleomonas cavernae TaxID=2320859 RepID=A0A418W9X5_9PROT|nr:NUDIX domain-containing protein [Oleomonas cavernae]RJF86815.1 NUDIX domain-containing protein [Oleomonas cavernae]